MNIFIDFIKNKRLFVYFALTVFILSGIIGALIYPETVIEEFLTLQEQVISQPDFFIFLRIFVQNTFVCALLAFGGLLTAIPTLIILIFNGYVLGILFRFFSEQTSIFYILIGIIPHGVFELTAVFLASGWGLYMGFSLKDELWVAKLKKTAKFFVYLLPLLLLAAIIETALILL